MMIKSLAIATLGAMIMSAPLTANARPLDRFADRYELRHGDISTPGIDRRVRRQHRRIRRGRRLGDLTRGEYRRLMFALFNIRVERRFAKRDGYVSFRERRRLQRMLTRNGRNIRRLRNNGNYRGFGHGPHRHIRF